MEKALKKGMEMALKFDQLASGWWVCEMDQFLYMIVKFEENLYRASVGDFSASDWPDLHEFADSASYADAASLCENYHVKKLH